MRTNWFIVIEAKGRWWVDNEGTAFGPFPTQERAVTEALTIARHFGDPNRFSRVYAPDGDRRQRLVWDGTV